MQGDVATYPLSYLGLKYDGAYLDLAIGSFAPSIIYGIYKCISNGCWEEDDATFLSTGTLTCTLDNASTQGINQIKYT